tara:strand:- start:27 stop:713 length:687 start_codon:yes stop_codon:yes gene_type:complete
MNVGLIGKGYWGKILLSKLKKIKHLDIKFIYGSKDDYKSKLNLVDWVFIATPNDTHYNIVKHCILSKKNIFCEKPLTPTYNQSLYLFKLAHKHNVKLYVDDVFNYRDEVEDLKKILKNKNNLKVIWKKESNNKLFDLLYHDLYLLYPILNKSLDINWPYINNIKFNYSGSDKTHIIDKIDFTHKETTNDALLHMIKCVLNNSVDYVYNTTITLFCNKIIDDISNNTNL